MVHEMEYTPLVAAPRCSAMLNQYHKIPEKKPIKYECGGGYAWVTPGLFSISVSFICNIFGFAAVT